MIFNPFDIQPINDAFQHSELLSWAPAQLQDNIFLVLFTLIFAVTDLLAWHPKGVMVHQFIWLAHTRNARTFEASAIVYPWLKPLLLGQYFLFFALCIFHLLDPQMAMHLNTFSIELLPRLVLSLALPLVWYLLHWFLIHWFSYLFETPEHCIIMNRCYHATHIVLAPASTIVFIGVLTGTFTDSTTTILLVTLFILSQIAFIFNGFKIFCTK